MYLSRKDILSSIIFGGIVAGITIGTFSLMDWNKSDDIQTYSKPAAEKYYTPTVNWVEYNVPDGRTSFKSYMSYRAITNTKSAQYRLQEECWTDDNGLRRYNNDYVIAVGSYYTNTIGERFKITLDSGNSFYAVIGDFKADKHTDSLHQYTPTESVGKCVVEFVVDTSTLDRTARKMGDISYIEGFDGNVEKMEKEYD